MTDTPVDVAAKLEALAEREEVRASVSSHLRDIMNLEANAKNLRAAASMLRECAEREKALREALRETAEDLELRMARNGEPTEASSPRADAEAGAAFGVLQRASALVRGK